MDFFTTTEFMTDLGLDLREQTAFAIIYSFSQDREGCWFGSIATMSKWLGNCTKATTVHTLQRLVDKGLVVKEDFWENEVKRCRYSTSKKIIEGYYKNYNGGIIKIKHNNDIDKSISQKNNKRYSNTPAFDFLSELLALGVDKQVAQDWLEVRKAKKGVNTKTALKDFCIEVAKTGLTANEAVRFAVGKSWCGFNAEWYKNATQKTTPVAPSYKREETPTLEGMMQRYGITPNNGNNYGPEEQ